MIKMFTFLYYVTICVSMAPETYTYARSRKLCRVKSFRVMVKTTLATIQAAMELIR